ncbi:MAG: CHAT domain-containing protein [Oscillatoria sp. SIO1A7]|nr:CHAT domain-containing protein [Oscillatoria sp. SIO1A7]
MLNRQHLPTAIKKGSFLFGSLLIASILSNSPAQAQSITEASDGTGTIVNQSGSQFDIEGGTSSGSNLFHSFDRFGLETGETANFQTGSSVENILGRIVGGDASIINGNIQVSGSNANLFLLNPAGIVFGADATLNVMGNFTASTANGIGFGNGNWFYAIGDNDYTALTGSPSEFVFGSGNGAIINYADLALNPGSNLTLLGSTVLSTGNLAAPGGQITVAAVPNSSLVRVGQPGHLLHLDIDTSSTPSIPASNLPAFTPLDLPGLLTDAGTVGNATQVTVNSDGNVVLTGSGLSVQDGDLVVNNVDSSSSTESGGAIALSANNNLIASGDINAGSSSGTGGEIAIEAEGKITPSNIATSENNITLSGAVVLENDIAFATGSGSGDIVFSSKVDGNSELSLDAGTGNVEFQDALGSSAALTLLDIDAGDVNATSTLNLGGKLKINASGAVNLSSIVTNGNPVNIEASDKITSSDILTRSLGDAGNVSIASHNGDISLGKIDAEAQNNGSGNGGEVTLEALNGAISLYGIDAGSKEAGNQAGDISIRARDNITATEKIIATAHNNAEPGNIEITSTEGSLDLDDIEGASRKNSVANAGSITLEATQGNVDTGQLWTGAYYGDAGSITVTAGGNIVSSADNGSHYILARSRTEGNGGEVRLQAGGDIVIPNAIQTAAVNGNGGSVSLSSNNSVTINNVITYSGLGDGGSISITALSDIEFGELFSGAFAGNGGDITLTTGGKITVNSSRLYEYFAGNCGGFDAVNVQCKPDGTLEITPNGTASYPALTWFLGIYTGKITISKSPSSSESVASSSGNSSQTGNSNSSQTGSSQTGDSNSEQTGDSNSEQTGNSNSEQTDNSSQTETGDRGQTEDSSDRSQTETGDRSQTETGDRGQTGQTEDSNSQQTRDSNSERTDNSSQTETDNNDNSDRGQTDNSSNDNLGIESIEVDREEGDDTDSVTITLELKRKETGETESSSISVSAENNEDGTTTFSIKNSNSSSSQSNSTTAPTDYQDSANSASEESGNTVERITNPNIIASPAFGKGGEVTLNAGNDIEGGSVVTRPFEIGSGGNISAASSEGGIDLNGQVNSSGRNDSGGDVTLTAQDDINVSGNIDTSSQTRNSPPPDLASVGIALPAETEQILERPNPNATGGDVSINSTAGSVDVSNINSFSDTGNGGNVQVAAQNDVATGNINTSSPNVAGSVNLASQSGNVTAGDINALGGVQDGAVTISAPGEINTGTIQSSNVSINPPAPPAPPSPSSSSIGGSLLPQPTIPVAPTQATVPAPSPAPENLVAPVQAMPETPAISNSSDFSVEAIAPPPPEILCSQSSCATGVNAQQQLPSAIAYSRNITESNIAVAPILNIIDPIAALEEGNIENAIQDIEESFTREYANSAGQDYPGVTMNLSSIRDTLKSISQENENIKPAVIYAIANPEQLGLIMITAEDKDVNLSQVDTGLRQDLIGEVEFFYSQVKDKNSEKDAYLQNASKLYDRLIKPLEAKLEEQGINTLIFSMDAGLRLLPLAALHDGEKFLIEKYNIALIPSVSLMDTSYVGIKNPRVLAMGADNFPDTRQEDLPYASVELATITKLLSGQTFLNEDFTLDGLKEARRQEEFSIVHLATHAVFSPELPWEQDKDNQKTKDNNYIQFWEERVGLEELREVEWYNHSTVELLVLSACETALGDEKAEMGFAGLAVQAGVKSAVASLWKVSDAGTLGLMAEFYQNLNNAPSKAEALRLAQLAMLRGEVRIDDNKLATRGLEIPLQAAKSSKSNNLDLTHPYYWAAFTTIGSPW